MNVIVWGELLRERFRGFTTRGIEARKSAMLKSGVLCLFLDVTLYRNSGAYED